MKECHYKENGGGGSCCYFHPKEAIVGVCHLCLNERLLIVAAKQGPNPHSTKLSSNIRSTSCRNSEISSRNPCSTNLYMRTKPSISLPKVFGLSSLFTIRNARPGRHEPADHEFFDTADDQDTASTSLEDESFISIKFGDNGVASWDKSTSTVSKVSLEDCSMSWSGHTHPCVKNATKKDSHSSNKTSSSKSVVEHVKPRTASLRWRKRIRQLLDMMRWKKSSKGGGKIKVEAVKRRNDRGGWIPTLRVRTKD